MRYIIEKHVYDYGQAVCALHLTLPAAPARALSPDDFSVTACNHRSFDWATKSLITSDYPRTITEVTVDGARVTLSLKCGFGIPGISRSYGAYRLLAINEIPYAGGAIPAGTELEAGDSYDPLADQFDAGEGHGLLYRIYRPAVQPGERHPLVIWLHGMGQGGTNNEGPLLDFETPAFATAEQQAIFGGAYILVPQCPTKWGNEYVPPLLSLIRDVAAQGQVDPGRIYIGGCSMGGLMTWKTIIADPDLFAAAFPVCGAYQPTREELNRLLSLPLWVIHATQDNAVPCEFSRESCAYLKSLGAPVRYTEFSDVVVDGQPVPALSHWSWVYVHRNFSCAEQADHIAQGIYPERFLEWVAQQHQPQEGLS